MVLYNNIKQYNTTRRSGHYAPILLAPAEVWGPFLGPSAPSSVAEEAKEDTLNLVSK